MSYSRIKSKVEIKIKIQWKLYLADILKIFSEKQENKKHEIRPDIKWTEIHQCALLRSGGYRRVSEIMAAPANRVDRYVDVESM